MRDVYVYRGRDNQVQMRLRSDTVESVAIYDPPLQGATKIVLKLDDGQTFDSTVDPEIEVIDSDTLGFRLGPSLLESEDPIRGYLSIFYTGTPNGIAWLGDPSQADQPTFRFIPVSWAIDPV